MSVEQESSGFYHLLLSYPQDSLSALSDTEPDSKFLSVFSRQFLYLYTDNIEYHEPAVLCGVTISWSVYGRFSTI